jgi:hypothetical protein
VQQEDQEDIPVLEGLGSSSGGDDVQPHQLQFLLAASDPTDSGGGKTVAEVDYGDGGRVNRSGVVPDRVDEIPRQARTVQVGHHRKFHRF